VTPKTQDTPELRRQQIVEALASPVDYTGLRLTARRLPPVEGPRAGTVADGKQPVDFMLGVMGNSITFDAGNGNAIDLRVTTLAFDANRKSVASISQAISTNFDAEKLQKIIRTGVGIPVKVSLPAGQYEIKFAVPDNLSGLLGTISVPLDANGLLRILELHVAYAELMRQTSCLARARCSTLTTPPAEEDVSIAVRYWHGTIPQSDNSEAKTVRKRVPLPLIAPCYNSDADGNLVACHKTRSRWTSHNGILSAVDARGPIGAWPERMAALGFSANRDSPPACVSQRVAPNGRTWLTF
jgi:hypothetical protein